MVPVISESYNSIANTEEGYYYAPVLGVLTIGGDDVSRFQSVDQVGCAAC